MLVAAVAAALTLTSCASRAPTPESALRFGYVTDGGRAVGLVRAFDDGQRTALQFVTDPPPALQVFDQAGLPLVLERAGQHVLLPGLYAPVRVVIGAASATVRRAGAEAPKELIQQHPPAAVLAAAVAPAAPAEPPELRHARAALDLAEQQIAELRAQLVREPARPGDRAIAGRIARLEALVASAAAVVLRVQYDAGDAGFQPSPALAGVLVPAARNADRVTVRAFTDASAITEDSRRAALARAVAARKALIDAGVDPRKVRAYYQSSGGWVADNTTEEGRALNRRVDVELKGLPSLRAALVASR